MTTHHTLRSICQVSEEEYQNCFLSMNKTKDNSTNDKYPNLSTKDTRYSEQPTKKLSSSPFMKGIWSSENGIKGGISEIQSNLTNAFKDIHLSKRNCANHDKCNIPHLQMYEQRKRTNSKTGVANTLKKNPDQIAASYSCQTSTKATMTDSETEVSGCLGLISSPFIPKVSEHVSANYPCSGSSLIKQNLERISTICKCPASTTLIDNMSDTPIADNLIASSTEPMINVCEKESTADLHDQNFDSNNACSSIELSDGMKAFSDHKDHDDEEDNDLDERDYFDSDDELLEHFEDIEGEESYMISCLTSERREIQTERYSGGINLYLNLPVLMKSIRKFAVENNFEVKSIAPNGNCMFGAVLDQLVINGEFCHTEESIRQQAIRYLRQNSYHDSGSHLESFLSGESWNEYLHRMANPTEWGDHIMLKAVSDSMNLVILIFNVVEDDIRQTEIKPKQRDGHDFRQTIYLGHIGEFHYISLRPISWEKMWPQKALTHISEKGPRKAKETRHDYGAVTIPTHQSLSWGPYYPTPTGAEQLNAEKVPINDKGRKQTHIKWGLNSLDAKLALPQSYLRNLAEAEADSIHVPSNTDSITGLNLSAVNYLIKHLLPYEMITKKFPVMQTTRKFENFLIEIIGSCCDGSNVVLEDLTEHRQISRSNPKYRGPSVIVFPLSDMGIPENSNLLQSGFFDLVDTQPGYCLLRAFNVDSMDGTQLCKIGSDIFLKAFEIPPSVEHAIRAKRYYAGYKCAKWPTSAEKWRCRKNTWPSESVKRMIIHLGCSVIQSPHPNSDFPAIEWKYEFSKAEDVILTVGLSHSQRYTFFVFKILVDYMTKHLKRKLKTSHLKAVFFSTCENISVSKWDKSLGGRLLDLLDVLIECLRNKNIPHYFISANNMLEDYSRNEIEAITIYVEAIRRFPVQSLQFLAERHGFGFGSKLSRVVLNDCFGNNNDMHEMFQNVFIPNTTKVARCFARYGFYEPAYALLREEYEEMLLCPKPHEEQSCIHPSFMEHLESALSKMRDKTSRLMLAKTFDDEFGTDITRKFRKKNCKCIKDAISFETGHSIGALEYEIINESDKDLSNVADYLDSFGFKMYKQGNARMAIAAVAAAIQCIKCKLSENTINEEEIQDDTLKAEIVSQKERIKSDLKHALLIYYIHIFMTSRLRSTITPLIYYMPEIEELCNEIPSMANVVSDMWFYIGDMEKGREYLAKCGTS